MKKTAKTISSLLILLALTVIPGCYDSPLEEMLTFTPTPPVTVTVVSATRVPLMTGTYSLTGR